MSAESLELLIDATYRLFAIAFFVTSIGKKDKTLARLDHITAVMFLLVAEI